MRLLRLAGLASAGVLMAFTLRRAALLAAAVRPRRQRVALPLEHGQAPIDVTILVPCRDEARSLPGLLAALDRLDYPPDHLRVVVVDDGSTDDTAAVARAWAAGRPGAEVLSLPANVGKAQALNAAVQQCVLPRAGRPARRLIVIYDADHRPAPDAVRRLAAAFADPSVGAASGQMRVANGEASPAAFYAHVESLVNQRITMQAKDRLDLAPALLGANCAYRLSALLAVGGFRAGALLEDSDLTLALALAGWRTRFVPRSVSDHHAPETVRGYVRQHLRWNRGFHQASGLRLRPVLADPRLSPWLRLELAFFALGYADRLALLAAALLTALGAFPRAVWAAYFGVPALEMIAALRLDGAPPRQFARLAYVPFFFALDIGVAMWAAVQSVLGKPIVWSSTERAM